VERAAKRLVDEVKVSGLAFCSKCICTVAHFYGGINPYTLTARLEPGGLVHHEDSSRLDPTARSFAQGNKTWRSSQILVG